MSTNRSPADSLDMPHRWPFAWIILVGICCSLGGLAVSRMADSAVASGPVSETSALPAVSAGGSHAVPTVVTKEPPSPSRPDAAVAGLVAATPTPSAALPGPALEPAGDASQVSSLPATGVVQTANLQTSREKSAALVDRMNGARVRVGGAALEVDHSLAEVALARARNLVANGYFEHYAPDGESAFTELAARGIQYRLAGENLARNNYAESRTVDAAFDGLMASPGHRANILEVRFSSVGVAAVQSGKMWVYVTIFLN